MTNSRTLYFLRDLLDAVMANSLENLGSDRASGSLLMPDGKVERWTDLPKAEFGKRLVAVVEGIRASRRPPVEP